MKVYISGKIGEETPSPETLKRFADAETKLHGLGYETFNPTTSGFGHLAKRICNDLNSMGTKTNWYTEIMNCDLRELSHCDAIYMIDGWQYSRGATAELIYAATLGKRIFLNRRIGETKDIGCMALRTDFLYKVI